MVSKILPLIFFLVALSSCAHRFGVQRSVEVSGQCFRQVEADRGQIDLTHVVLEKDIQTATRSASEKYSRLKSEVENLKLKDLELKTLSYSVQERMDWVKDRQVSRGYEARMTLQVTSSEIARMGEVLQVAGNNRVKEVGSLRTFTSNAKRESERGECLKEAVLDAKRKAEGMAQSLNASVGRAMQIVEDGSSVPRPMMMEQESMAMPMAKAMRGAAPAPQIEGGNEELRYSVSVSFEVR
ncbi:MAG: SIMPL domain-containing protein [Bdellovibrionota bacterium]